ncbi:PREDICTED: uncharacterized protein LOC104787994 [Camelina sativa]|uniref:Uncharacterized protein LOC104787994 n=1 Tax=Camelina sativa TaxID=90675 RepID=A0ABM0Z8M1_CAMSA|nr:PREDICTED: uncharacterized protein LOC104787994 [Camelina sativa]
MGETVHCESFLPSSSMRMRDLTQDSNTCTYSMFHARDPKNNLPFGARHYHHHNAAATDSSYSDFLKHTMLQHEAVFKNQVCELHRLYRTQKSLMDEVKGKTFIDLMSYSERTPESAIKRELPGFLLGSDEGSSSLVCNAPSSKDQEEVFEVRPVKVRRTVIDLQPPPYEQSKTEEEEEVEEKLFFERGNASHHLNDSSGSSLLMKNRNGLADLNEPLQCQESVPVSSSSRDLYSSLYGRDVANVQGQWLDKNTSQNGWMVLEAGHGKSIPRDNLCLPSHSVQGLSNSAFQPLGYPSTDQRKLSGERASFEWEARQRNPEVSYDSYVESSVASNAPSLNHGYHPESVRPWGHWISSWENRSSSSVQKPVALQTNPFLNFNTQPRTDASSEMRSRDFNQGFSSGSKETAFNFPSGNSNYLNNGPKGAVTNGSFSEALKHQSPENPQGPKKQECSAGLPWMKPKPHKKNGIANGGLDLNLNASANQFMDGSDVGNSLNNVYPHNGLTSVSCSNGANLGYVEMAESQSRGKIFGCPIPQKHSICEGLPSLIPSSASITNQPKKVNTLVKRNLDINLPCEDSVSEAVIVDNDKGKKAATYRQHIDLNLCANEDEDSSLCYNPRVETKATTLIDLEAPPDTESEEDGEKILEKRGDDTWKSEARDSVDEFIKAAAEAIVTISLSHHCNTDEAASSSTNAVAKDPLSWFVNTIASCGNDLEKKIACLEARDCVGCPEECSSGEFDYFETMTLNLPQTKEEDYMPKPLVPEYLKFDETGSMGITANRPRRGQARRGRPRRDFQRDILPGLASLSRLEVTEDLHMFEGLMKATCYNWNSGVARRSSNRGGSSRGRKRLVNNIDRAPVCSSLAQPINNNSVQMVGLEDRSLTGWGTATRRPRRQRCPASNPPTVILT